MTTVQNCPKSEWYTSDVDGKVKNTIGKVNTDREIKMFGTNTQPLYAIIDHEGNLLGEKMEHNLDVDEYLKWMDAGIEAFKK